MKLPEEGTFVLDRKDSSIWFVREIYNHIIPGRSYSEDISEKRFICEGHSDKDGTRTLNEGEDFVFGDCMALEPMDVLQHAKFLTEQACASTGEKQKEFCKTAMWLLNWFIDE